MRMWISKMLFEKLLRWPSAQEVGEKIFEEVDKYNNLFNKPKCYKCSSSNLVNDVSGSESILTSPHYFYRCRDCGNAQDDDGRWRKWDFEELAKKRIKKNGVGKYRYIIITSNQCWILVVLGIIAFVIGLVKILFR
jgi:hypothetical protein